MRFIARLSLLALFGFGLYVITNQSASKAIHGFREYQEIIEQIWNLI